MNFEVNTSNGITGLLMHNLVDKFQIDIRNVGYLATVIANDMIMFMTNEIVSACDVGEFHFVHEALFDEHTQIIIDGCKAHTWVIG